MQVTVDIGLRDLLGVEVGDSCPNDDCEGRVCEVRMVSNEQGNTVDARCDTCEELWPVVEDLTPCIRCGLRWNRCRCDDSDVGATAPVVGAPPTDLGTGTEEAAEYFGSPPRLSKDELDFIRDRMVVEAEADRDRAATQKVGDDFDSAALRDRLVEQLALERARIRAVTGGEAAKAWAARWKRLASDLWQRWKIATEKRRETTRRLLAQVNRFRAQLADAISALAESHEQLDAQREAHALRNRQARELLLSARGSAAEAKRRDAHARRWKRLAASLFARALKREREAFRQMEFAAYLQDELERARRDFLALSGALEATTAQLRCRPARPEVATITIDGEMFHLGNVASMTRWEILSLAGKRGRLFAVMDHSCVEVIGTDRIELETGSRFTIREPIVWCTIHECACPEETQRCPACDAVEAIKRRVREASAELADTLEDEFAHSVPAPCGHGDR